MIGQVSQGSQGYGVVAAIVVLGLGGLGGAFALNKALTVTYPTPDKLKTYESGVDPVGEGWAQVHIRYYLFAYLYVVFAAVAAFALVSAWRKGILAWT